MRSTSWTTSLIGSCFGSAGEDNWGKLSDAEIDRLVAIESSSPDPTKATEALRAAYRRVVELQPWTFLFYRNECSVRSPRLRGLDANPREPLAWADRWWVPRDSR